MDAEARWPDDADQFSTRQLAARAAISPTTITNWAERPEDPLPMRRTGGRKVFCWGELVAFTRRHPHLPAARDFQNRIRASSPTVPDKSTNDRATLKAIAQDVRAAAAAASDAALETAELHLKTVKSLRAAIAGLDGALTLALASDTIND